MADSRPARPQKRGLDPSLVDEEARHEEQRVPGQHGELDGENDDATAADEERPAAVLEDLVELGGDLKERVVAEASSRRRSRAAVSLRIRSGVVDREPVEVGSARNSTATSPDTVRRSKILAATTNGPCVAKSALSVTSRSSSSGSASPVRVGGVGRAARCRR